MEADKKVDTEAVVWSGALPSAMEPMLFSEASRHRSSLTELVFDLGQKSAAFRASLPAPLAGPLADLVRAMNCYYSNLIEGHNTHPVDIERALRKEFTDNQKQRDLQLEAASHITVQQWLDGGGLTASRALTVEGMREIHRRFFANLPDHLMWIEDPKTHEKVRIVPGELRASLVQVGRHIPIAPDLLPPFLHRFEAVYGRLSRSELVLYAAAAHHRLAWIHPFLDGNGRVGRLVTHAILLEVLDTGGVWSVARGLGRNIEPYKQLLANCDQQRRNDLDGRGNLSEEALAAFTKFFLEQCLDQVAFMRGLLQPDRLRARIIVWAKEEIERGALLPQSVAILRAILQGGELPRGEVEAVAGTGERQARRAVEALVKRGALTSSSSRAPLHLAFPATLAARWLPGLFPESP